MKHFIYILIPACALLPFRPQAQQLLIGPGAQLVVTGAPSLVLNNTSLVNNGRFTADSSTVLFAGARHASIGGYNPLSFYNLVIDIPRGEVQLNNNAAATGSITMNNGNLQLNNYTLNLGSSGRISHERNEARIIGNNGGAITITALLNAPHAVNPGNIGVEITSDANLGPTVITRGHLQQSNDLGQTGIQRYFDVLPSFNTTAPATLRFYYFDAELAGYNKNGLQLFSGKPAGKDLVPRGKDQGDGTDNWILKNNLPALQRFTLAPAPRNTTTASSLQLYPNPSRNTFTMVLLSDKEKEGTIGLRDQDGRLLETKTVHCQAGINKIEWNISGYAAGAYYLESDRLGVQHATIVKQ
ncbi:MAG TPA: hypothetical protein VLD19_10780 [Chitinophagaceae bacterium]|nr:hypothetical protein [Chitinophagaceae bacterium]